MGLYREEADREEGVGWTAQLTSIETGLKIFEFSND
jgi:hypothetical protein